MEKHPDLLLLPLIVLYHIINLGEKIN
jgi:hypothetical protein